LKDLNQSQHLEALLDAGVRSLKIEGRLKDVSYVKNVTAFYRKQLDHIFSQRTEFTPASSGKCSFFFQPSLSKSFNRGFTPHFLHGKTRDIAAIDSPKSVGESIGHINDINNSYFTISGQIRIHNGDGICFFDDHQTLQGFRVNRVENNRVYPAKMPRINRGTMLYRNIDYAFEKGLSQPSSERKIQVDFILQEHQTGYSLTVIDEDGYRAGTFLPCNVENAQKDQQENIKVQLSKLGSTIFSLNRLDIQFQSNRFIPSSLLNELRRKAIDNLLSVRKISFLRPLVKIQPTSHPFPLIELNYQGNVSNPKANQFYQRHGVNHIEPAYEITPPFKQEILMFSKYCIRYQLGYCTQTSGSKPTPFQEPLFLIGNGIKLQLQFNCEECEMNVLEIKNPGIKPGL
jgi:putative protease